MALVFLGLGSNMGDRMAHIQAARNGLAILPDSDLVKNAGIYETAPVGGPAGQDAYFNSASLMETRLQPLELLSALHTLERSIGRRREEETVRWGPRIIDIDILLWEDRVVEEKDLTVPHPRLAERAFALYPLVEIDRDLLHPTLELTVTELLQRIGDGDEGIRRVSL